MNSATIVQKLWNYCNVLRDDGMSYGDYVEQLTYLLFLKMADERSRPPWSQSSPIAKGFDWPSMLAKDGDDLFDHYRHTLEKLGNEKGTIGLIFGKAQNKFQDPVKLRRLVLPIATTARRPGARSLRQAQAERGQAQAERGRGRARMVAGACTATTNWCGVTRPAWIFSGSRTIPWPTATTCRRPM